MPDIKAKNLGNSIKRFREKGHLTQDDLAEALNVKRATISSYEVGKAVPPINILIKLAEIFKTSIDGLLTSSKDSKIMDEKNEAKYDDEYEEFTEGFGNIIREERRDQNLTQKELSDQVDISQGLLSQYERDVLPIPGTMADKLAQALGYDDRNDILDHYGILFSDKEQAEFDRVNDEDHWQEEADAAKKLQLGKNGLPSLNDKDDRDIGKQLEKILNNMKSNTALAFDGEPMDKDTQELVTQAIESSLKLAKQIAKKKFTPKKYRDWE